MASRYLFLGARIGMAAPMTCSLATPFSAAATKASKRATTRPSAPKVSTAVTQVVVDDGRAVGVRVRGGEEIRAGVMADELVEYRAVPGSQLEVFLSVRGKGTEEE